jgi:phosphoribosylaminoimidazole-succinocarboxamide synthase
LTDGHQTVTTPIFESSIRSLTLLGRGKVRDIYAVDADTLLIVTSDRLSAFDVILPDPIPRKGRVLVAMANFWFAKLGHIVPNQLTGIDPETVVAADERDQVRGRALVVKRLTPLPIEAVVRGYVIGSGWKDYQDTGAICGIDAARGPQAGGRSCPSRSSPRQQGRGGRSRREHLLRAGPGAPRGVLAEGRAQGHRQDRRPARRRGARRGDRAVFRSRRLRRHPRHLIADTKFEFGIDAAGTLHLIDEALTPDSSRFWPADGYRRRHQPAELRQAVRARLPGNAGLEQGRPRPEAAGRRHRAHRRQVREAYERLTGQRL